MARKRREQVVSNEEFGRYFTGRVESARRLAWRLLGGDDAAADDAIQDAFVRAYRSLSGFRGDTTLDTWFYRILVRTVQNRPRGGWRPWRHREASGPLEGQAPEEASAESLLAGRLRSSMARLTRRQREAFVLVHLEDFTVQEAAHLLGRPEGAVETHLQRAAGKLRADLHDVARRDDEERPKLHRATPGRPAS